MLKFPKNSPQYNQIFDSIVSDSVKKGRTFCRAADTLVCDKTTARCVCGEDYVQAILRNRYNLTNYVTEWDAGKGKNVCRYARGEPCVPHSFILMDGSFYLKCGQGLSCNYVKDGTTCTDMASLEYSIESARNNETNATGVLAGKMCTCETKVADDDANRKGLKDDEETYAQAKSVGGMEL
ncbi:hypothetical protein Fcan01_25668 [Folsomia candida]|uniref:Uncharacterized protein n=1 Tax=Folsomia candida TaxID=158441 RepID=A0A226D3W1_FOLCA|nr:hypothetical protein Fcan01_25668 [Folsomia candida]